MARYATFTLRVEFDSTSPNVVGTTMLAHGERSAEELLARLMANGHVIQSATLYVETQRSIWTAYVREPVKRLLKRVAS